MYSKRLIPTAAAALAALLGASSLAAQTTTLTRAPGGTLLATAPPAVPATLPVAGLAAASLNPWDQSAPFKIGTTNTTVWLYFRYATNVTVRGQTIEIGPGTAMDFDTGVVPNGWYAVRLTFGNVNAASTAQTFNFVVSGARSAGTCVLPGGATNFSCTSQAYAVTDGHAAFAINGTTSGGASGTLINVLVARIR